MSGDACVSINIIGNYEVQENGIIRDNDGMIVGRVEQLITIADLTTKLFQRVEKEGLYVGGGYNSDLPDSKQEGPIVKKLKKALNTAGKL